MSISKSSTLLAAAVLAVTVFANDAKAQTVMEWLTLDVKGERVPRKLDQKAVVALSGSIARASTKLLSLAKRPAPRGISKAEAGAYKKSQVLWRKTAQKLRGVSASMNRLGSALRAGGNFGDTPGLNGGDMVAQMAALNQQFLALQQATQGESRRFQTLSNASKARHEIAMGAIRNMK